MHHRQGTVDKAAGILNRNPDVHEPWSIDPEAINDRYSFRSGVRDSDKLEGEAGKTLVER